MTSSKKGEGVSNFVGCNRKSYPVSFIHEYVRQKNAMDEKSFYGNCGKDTNNIKTEFG